MLESDVEGGDWRVDVIRAHAKFRGADLRPKGATVPKSLLDHRLAGHGRDTRKWQNVVERA